MKSLADLFRKTVCVAVVLALSLVSSAQASPTLKQQLAAARDSLAKCHDRVVTRTHRWSATSGRALKTGRFVSLKPETAFVARECPPAAGEYTTTASKLRAGLGLTGGFRWDRETDCPDGSSPAPPLTVTAQKDPVFIGLEDRFALTPRWEVGGNFDRDIYQDDHWVSAAHWNARAFLSYHPWRK